MRYPLWLYQWQYKPTWIAERYLYHWITLGLTHARLVLQAAIVAFSKGFQFINMAECLDNREFNLLLDIIVRSTL